MNVTKSIARTAARIGYPIGSLLGGFRAGISNQGWEGNEFTRQRHRPPRATESTDRGLNFGIREGLLSEARNLEQTFAICRRINRQYARHTIGSCRIKWQTGNPAIDKVFSDAWITWMKICDLQGRHNFRKLTKIAVARTLVDGRIFGQLDRRAGFLQIQGIEGDRVSSDGIFNSDRLDLVSGIGLDANGRAQYARVWQRTLYGMFQNPQDIPFDQLVHVFDSDRIDSVSGVTHYHTVLNKVRDLKETMLAEQLSAKKNSKWAMIWNVVTGGAPISSLLDDDFNKNAADAKPDVQRISDVADAYILPGEDVKAFTSERPSEGWRYLMEMIIREIALGLDLPFGVVWSMTGLGGPAVRFEIMQASRTFEDFLCDTIEPMWIRPIVGAWITLEMAAGRLPFHANWYRFAVPKPKSITIDFGRDSKASIAENIAGLGTAADWYSEEDENFEDQIDQLVYEARYRECKRRNIPFDANLEVPLEQIRLITPNGNVNQSDPGLDGGDETDTADTTPNAKNKIAA
jgi:capsid protein